MTRPCGRLFRCAAITCAAVMAACGGEASRHPSGASAPTGEGARSPLGDGALASAADAAAPGAGCARSPGFYCQAQAGHPEISAEAFTALATTAATLLVSVPDLDTHDEVAVAVCDESEQLPRQLAALALNLAASLVAPETQLVGESFQGRPLADVAAAFAAAVGVANGTTPADLDERNAIKDVIDRINNNQSAVTHCSEPAPGRGDGGEDEGDDGGVSQMTVCHVPPGNPRAAHTIVISTAAWPAHRAHGDTEGPCP